MSAQDCLLRCAGPLTVAACWRARLPPRSVRVPASPRPAATHGNPAHAFAWQDHVITTVELGKIFSDRGINLKVGLQGVGGAKGHAAVHGPLPERSTRRPLRAGRAQRYTGRSPLACCGRRLRGQHASGLQSPPAQRSCTAQRPHGLIAPSTPTRSCQRRSTTTRWAQAVAAACCLERQVRHVWDRFT